MMKTPRSELVNESQKVLKSIAHTEEISLLISKKVDGKDLKNILEGVAAFTGAFNPEDKYSVDVKLSKVIEPERQVNADEGK